jgi:single-strand DNA-binding protein
MLNKTVLIGRLTKDPELRYTPNGVAVTQFTLAVDRPFTNQDGTREADFIPIVVWRKIAEAAANHLQKGSLVAVDGRIQVRHYDNNEGRRVYVTEVIAENVRFLSKTKEAMSDMANVGQSDPFDISDEDLPF